MATRWKVGLVQMRSTENAWENLSLVDSFVKEATSSGCAWVAFPENVFYRGPRSTADFSRDSLYLSLTPGGQLSADSEFSEALAEISKSWAIPVVLGSVFERGPGLPYNSQWVLNPDGSVLSYRKIHLFHYDGEKASYRESAECTAGGDPTTVEIAGLRVGLTICFDLRFPELYRVLALRQGAEALLVPSCFTESTGLAHWHALLRARAIENQCYVLAPAQWGTHRNQTQELKTFGHTLAYDPWGELLGDLGPTGDGLLSLEIDRERLTSVRNRLPALQNAKLHRREL